MNAKTMAMAAGGAMILAAALASAQPMGVPMGRWWERPKVAEQIGLTQEQTQKLEAVTLDEAKAMVDLKGAVQKAEIDLRAAADLEPFQPEKVRDAFRVVQQARTRLETQRFEMLLKVRGILSADQWHKLRELVRERGAMRGREGDDERSPRRRPN
jgi:Spy/CpxP family protein refolding chaperone